MSYSMEEAGSSLMQGTDFSVGEVVDSKEPE